MRAPRSPGQREPAPAGAQWRAIPLEARRTDRALGCLAAAVLLSIAFAASAQVSGNASLVSDYRYRGVSLSHDDPALQASIAYDDPSGLYAGAFASSVKFGISPQLQAQLVPYFGYARRFASGLAAEFGADYSAFTGPGRYDYAEVYAGVANDNVSARLYYAPRYFGRESGSFYGEINASQPLGEQVRLLVHVGMLVNQGSYPPYGPTDRRVVDGRIGAAIDIAAFTLQASWVGIGSGSAGYPIAQSRRNTAVLTLSTTF